MTGFPLPDIRARIVPVWTGSLARTLVDAYRISVQDFAQRSGIGVRTITAWRTLTHDRELKLNTQGILDDMLFNAPPEVVERFAQLSGKRA